MEKRASLNLRLIVYKSINYLITIQIINIVHVTSYSRNISSIVGGIVFKQYNPFKYYLIVTCK